MRRLAIIAASLLASSALAQAETTLTYMMWVPDQLEIETRLIKQFEAANDGVHIEVQALTPKEYWPKLSALAAAGDLPDVFAMSSGFVKSWAEAGNLKALDAVVADTDLGAYFDGAIAPGVVNGKMVAFPQSWVAPVLYYNKDMFDAASLDYPSKDWTWTDFRDAAKALTLDTNEDGTTDQWGMWLYGRYAHVEPWVFRNGGTYLNADETEIVINEQAKNALEMLTNLVLTDKSAPAPQDMKGIRQEDVFPMGMAAMWVDGSWNIANVRKVADPSMNWGIAQVPVGPDATSDTAKAYAWSDMLSVAETSENPDLAWKFIQFMVGEGRSASDFLGGTVPAYKSIAESEAWLEADQMPDNKAIILQIGAQPVYTGFSKNWSAWRGYAAEGAGGMTGELDEVLNGRKDLDAALDAITSYGNEVLAR